MLQQRGKVLEQCKMSTYAHIAQQRLENDKATVQFMDLDLDADKERKILEKYVFLSVARVKQFASTAFSA